MTAPMDCLNLAPMGSERTDEELMLAYAGGDLLAFEMLYRRHRGTLYRFLLRSLRQRADADELFQETWSRAVAARERYRVEAKFTTWLLQIAHNLVIDRFRRARPQASAEEAEIVFNQLDSPEDEQPDRVLSEFEQRRRLQIALEDLPEEQRVTGAGGLKSHVESIVRVPGGGEYNWMVMGRQRSSLGAPFYVFEIGSAPKAYDGER